MALVSISCPTCNHPGNIPETHLFKRVRCRQCHALFVATITDASELPETASAPETEPTPEVENFALLPELSPAVGLGNSGRTNDLTSEGKAVYSNRIISVSAVVVIGAAILAVIAWQFVERDRNHTLAILEQIKKTEAQEQLAELKDQVAKLGAEQVKSAAERERIAEERERIAREQEGKFQQENARREQLRIEEEKQAQARIAEEARQTAEQNRVSEERQRDAIERAKRQLIESAKEADKKGRQAMLEYSLTSSNQQRVIRALEKVGRLVKLHHDRQFDYQSIAKSLGYVSPDELEEMRFIMKRLGVNVVVNISDSPDKWVSMPELFEKFLKIALGS